MSRKIKTSILKTNNLRSVGSLSSQDPPYLFKSCASLDQPQLVRLKSLSEQRNIVKTLKLIDSPGKQDYLGFNLLASVKPQIGDTLSRIQEQLYNRSKSKTQRQERRESIQKTRKSGVPYSKIQLGGLGRDKDKARKQNSNTNQQTMPSVGKPIRRGLVLTGQVQTKTISLHQSKCNESTKSRGSLQTSGVKRRGIELIRGRTIVF